MINEKVDQDLLYFAGIFDGEGSACITRTTHNGYVGREYKYSSTIRVTMGDTEPVEALHKFFGGALYIECKGRNEKRKPMLTWTVGSTTARNAARQLLPYVRIERKRMALECVIMFGDTISLNGRPLSLEHYQLREMLYQATRKLNKTGKNNSRIDISKFKPETLQLGLFDEEGYGIFRRAKENIG